LKREFNGSMVLHKYSNNEWWNFKNSSDLFLDANVRALVTAVDIEEGKDVFQKQIYSYSKVDDEDVDLARRFRMRRQWRE
jgi:hypothetical protein